MSSLFEPLTLAGVTLRNRIAVSPMCQYSANDGHPVPWHMVHLGSRAVGGAGLVIVEASAVEARGRISPEDSGIWSDAHAESWAPIAKFIAEQGATAGIQIAHAGRKASTAAPWRATPGNARVLPEAGGWDVVGPNAKPFDAGYPVPTAMTVEDIDGVVAAFGSAAKRAVGAGFGLIEIHGAHGYLAHEFLSPLSNDRTDAYGGSFENRTRFLRRIIDTVRGAVPESVPVILRISATDWTEGGWDLEQSVALVQSIAKSGIDLVDVSSGGNVPHAKIPVGPGYQTSFAAEIRRQTGVKTGTVGLITSSFQADHAIRTGQADLVLLARELLRDPYWPRRAAADLGAKIPAPVQYGRAW